MLGLLCLVITLTLMRLRNLILRQERRRPWVAALVNKGLEMSPAFSSFAAFLAMGGYAPYVWLAAAAALAGFGLLTAHTCGQRRALFSEFGASRPATGGLPPRVRDREAADADAS